MTRRPAQSDKEPATPAEVPDLGHLAGALTALEAAAAALHVRAEAAEKRADSAEVERQAAKARADHAVVEKDEANRRADALQVWLDATQLELAGLRALIAVAQDPQSVAEALRRPPEARKARGRLRRVLAAWRGE
jgi:hypothetical protein